MFRRLLLAASCLAVFASLPARAAETQPGDSCAGQTDLIRTVGGPENPGTGYLLVCDGTVWKAVNTWDSASGKSLFQVNTDTGSCTATKLGRLRYNGSSTWEYCNGTSWTALPGSVTPAGADRQVQFNSNGNLAASSNMTYNSTGDFGVAGGKFGIGTTAPAYGLDIDKTTFYIRSTSPAYSYIYGTQGKLNFGGSGSPTAPVCLTGAWTASGGVLNHLLIQPTYLRASANNDALNALYIDPTFQDNGKTGVAHNAIIVTNGNVGIGTMTPATALDVVGNIQFTGTIADVSDRRLKADIAPLSPQLARIGALAPVSFTMKDDPARRTELGLIAQDVEAVYPDLVSTNPNGTKAMNYQGLIAPMIAAMQEQQREIEALRAENAALSRRLDAIEEAAAFAPAPLPRRLPPPLYNQ